MTELAEMVGIYARKIMELERRLAAAERDAERYQWLRDSPVEEVDCALLDRIPTEWDAAIDAARADKGGRHPSTQMTLDRVADDKAWANDSLRLALQQVQDVATKPLHVEIERLTREVERLQSVLEGIAGFRLLDFMGPHAMALRCVDVARIALALAPAAQGTCEECGWDNEHSPQCSRHTQPAAP